MFMSLALLAWSVVELVSLVFRHTTGAELYGVLVAFLAVVAGSLTLYLTRSAAPQTWLMIAVVVLWAVIAIGGLAGVYAHIVGPVPGHGAVDLRPRPLFAPLAFTAMGVVGELVLWLGRRQPARSVDQTEMER
jgi:hypothetical protein